MSFTLTIKKYAPLLLGLVVLAGSGTSVAAVKDEIRERIMPAGQLCVMGEDCAAGMAMASAGSGEPKEPESVYNTSCFACHGTGANNAPVFANAEAWAPRIEKGMDALYENAINGFNNGAMPARGLCMDCSDDDIKATVQYMVDAAQ